MNKSFDEIFDKFHRKLKTEFVYNINKFEYEILESYNQLLGILCIDYDTYRKYIPHMLYDVEHYGIKSLSYSMHIFLELFNKLIATKTISKIDLSVFEEKITDHTYKKFIKLFEEKIKSSNRLRISEFAFDNHDLSNQEMKEIVSLIIDELQDSSRIINWKVEQADIIMMQMPFLRFFLNTLNNSELFYYSAGMFLDRLNTSEYFQAARDFSEELLISSFNDNVPEYGFFTAFRCYSNQKSVYAAILFANISLHCALNSGRPISNKYLQEVILQSIKLFRNAKLFPLAINIYNKIPSILEFSEYDRRSLDHTYFTCLLSEHNSDLPDIILEYLHKERESILQAGIHESTPWLITLYNIQRLFPNADFSLSGLGFYLSVFEKIVPKETFEKYKDIVDGDSSKLKNYLKKSLIKLNETRNTSDIVHDNETALTIANRLIKNSFEKHDEEAILLAMMLKSDFSLIFQSKESKESAPFKLPNDKLGDLDTFYSDKKANKDISTDISKTYIWLTVTEGNVFQLSLHANSFYFNFLENWDWLIYDKLCKSGYFSSLSFDDTIKDKNGIREISKEEYIEQSIEIVKKINFCKTNIDKKTTTVYLIKDMELASFPHNLILDKEGSFVHLEKPVANILSTEWYLSCRDDSSIGNEFSKSIWIPTEEGDFTLNQLYGSLEESLDQYLFNVYKYAIIESPMSSELNIICSHGGADIASKQVLYPGNNPLLNLNHIIGNGKILIFFVCHSGSYQNEFFSNNITSIVKTYIKHGYRAVIAPFWALHVNIPKIWLPVFIQSLNKGVSIDLALFAANKAVYSKYQTPSAWASMHLYGNPHLVVKKENSN